MFDFTEQKDGKREAIATTDLLPGITLFTEKALIFCPPSVVIYDQSGLSSLIGADTMKFRKAFEDLSSESRMAFMDLPCREPQPWHRIMREAMKNTPFENDIEY